MSKKSSGTNRQVSQPKNSGDGVSTSAPRGDAFHRIFLAVTAFTSGMSIMIIELAGNRVLSPMFGNSLYTWTGLIGVLLVSIGIGYYVGGALADRRPEYRVLGHLLTGSAILTLTAPVLSVLIEPLAANMGIVSGPVIVTSLVLSIPICVLATVAPFCVRLVSLLTSDKHIGLSAGSMGMFGTLGSVAGTFLAGFVLIPHFQLRFVFVLTGGILGVLALIAHFLVARPEPRQTGNTILFTLFWALFAAAAIFVVPSKPAGTLFEEQTFYHRIRVTEVTDGYGDARYLHLDSTSEGAQYVGELATPFDYQEYWQLANLFCPTLDRAVFLGGGAFTMPELLSRAYPDAEIQVVELDPEVIEVGKRYFRLDEFPRVNAVAQEARYFLRNQEGKYDLIFGDAFHGVRYIPAHLVTAEFADLVRQRLAPDGIYVMNIISAVHGRYAGVYQALRTTLESRFPHVYTFATMRGQLTHIQNIILMASDKELDVEGVNRQGTVSLQERALLDTYLPASLHPIDGGIVLTDQRNPIDYLVATSLGQS